MFSGFRREMEQHVCSAQLKHCNVQKVIPVDSCPQTSSGNTAVCMYGRGAGLRGEREPVLAQLCWEAKGVLLRTSD